MAKITQEEAEAMLQRHSIEVSLPVVRKVMTMMALDLSEDFIVDSLNVSDEDAKSFSKHILDALQASGKTLVITNSMRKGEPEGVVVDLIDKDSARTLLTMGGSKITAAKLSFKTFDPNERSIRSSEHDGQAQPGEHEGGSPTKH